MTEALHPIPVDRFIQHNNAERSSERTGRRNGLALASRQVYAMINRIDRKAKKKSKPFAPMVEPIPLLDPDFDDLMS